MKIMIDTNVVLDVLLRREPFFSASYEVIKQSALEKCEGFVSASAATDIFYLLRRSLKDTEKARESMEKLLQLIGIADALGEDVYAANASNMTDFEDALVASIAERCRMAYIVTHNVKDYCKSPVKAITPEEFLRL
jgi:predicted nucleic acid-binding protein